MQCTDLYRSSSAASKIETFSCSFIALSSYHFPFSDPCGKLGLPTKYQFQASIHKRTAIRLPKVLSLAQLWFAFPNFDPLDKIDTTNHRHTYVVRQRE
jgi:hypothetical protein